MIYQHRIWFVILSVAGLFTLTMYSLGQADTATASITNNTVDTSNVRLQQAAPSDNELAMDLWQTLQESDYRQNWPLLKGERYPGQAPHGALVTIYLNEIANEAVESQPGQMPVDAIILKDNFKPDETLASVTIMQKRSEYDPNYGNWFWAKYGPDGTVQAAGKVGSCIACHGAVQSNDYLFSAPIAPIQVERSEANDSQSTRSETGSAAANDTSNNMASDEAAEITPEALISAGEMQYEANCAACHQTDGTGSPPIYPPLDASTFVTRQNPQPVISIVLTGRAGMPSFQDELSNREIAEVLSYIRHGWRNDASIVTPDDVIAVRETASSDREPSESDQ